MREPEDAINSEFEKFLLKMKEYPEMQEALQYLTNLIYKIAENYGAQDCLFRFENSAEALPPYPNISFDEFDVPIKDFPLRLYCYRVSCNILILFNGGIKTDISAQNGETSVSFREANRYSKKIIKELQSGLLEISENQRKLYIDHDNDLILI